MWITVLLVAISFFLLFFNYRKRCMKAVDLPGPAPHWLTGNLSAIHFERSPLLLQLREWTKEYGRMYVYYEGPTPVVVVSDPDLAQEVLVKKFSHFHGRKRLPLQKDISKSDMLLTDGERWKRLRTVVNPAFTELKMRAMFPLIKGNVDRLIASLDRAAAKGPVVKIYDFYKRLTLDVIAECAFGVSLNTQDNPQHPVLLSLRQYFEVQLVKRNVFFKIAIVLPEMRTWIRAIALRFSKQFLNRGFLMDRMEEVIEERRNPDARRVDILQLLLDAENVGEERSKEVKKALSTQEVKDQAVLFLFAGYETSSTALGYITYLLAKHPEVQERLQKEVDQLYAEMGEEKVESQYERFSELSYMDNVINESLRFFPIANIFITRRCARATEVGGHAIPAGANVAIDVFSMHFDRDLWGPTDPAVFDPDRFNTKRHALAWLPFGAGPRFCVGQRFALMQIRAALLRLMRRFNIRVCAETQEPLRSRYGITNTPTDVTVRLERRQIE